MKMLNAVVLSDVLCVQCGSGCHVGNGFGRDWVSPVCGSVAAPPRGCRGTCGTSKPRFVDDFNQRWAGVTLTSYMSVILLPRSLQSFGNMFNWTRESSGKG